MAPVKRRLQPALSIDGGVELPPHFQHLFDAIGEAVFETDQQGFLTYVNSPIERLFGYAPDDVLGKHFSTFIHPDWRDEVTAFYARQFCERIPETTQELQIVTYSGEARWIEQRVILIFENKQVAGCCGVTRDISERKQMEERLNDSERLFRSIIENTDDIIFIKDLNGRYVVVNPAYVQELNRTIDNVLDKTDLELFGEARGRLYRALDRSVLESGETRYLDEVREADGVQHHYSVTKFPLRSQNGETRGVVTIGHNLTARKVSEEAIRVSEERFRKLVEMTAALVFVSRDQFNLVYANPALSAATGYTVNELLTMTVFDLIHPDEHPALQAWIHELADEKLITTHHELRLKRKDGSDCWIDMAIKPIPTGGMTVLLGTGLDINERRGGDTRFQDSQLFIERLNAAVPDGLYVFDLTTMRIVYTNQKVGQSLGIDHNQFETSAIDTLTQMIHPDDVERLADSLTRFQNIRDDEIVESTYRIKTVDGEWRWIHIRTAVFQRDANGNVTQILGVARDVTEQEAAETALKKSEAKTQQFLEYLKALNEINTELSEVESFDDLCRRAIELGRSRLRFDRLGLLMLDAESGQVCGTFGVDSDGNLRDERAMRVSKHHNLDWVMHTLTEKRRIRVQQDTRLYDNWEVVGQGWNAMALLLSGDQVIGWLAADNLTRQEPLQDYQLELLSLYAATLEHLCIRKRNEEALRASEERYRAVVEDQSEFICRYSPDTRLTFVNEAQCRYYGKTREQLIGQPFLNDVPPDYHQPILARIRESIVTRQPFTYQHPAYYRNGELHWQEWTDRPIFDEAGNLIEFQAIGQDIEERRRREAERNDYISRLEVIRRVDVELTEKLDIDYVLQIAADAAVRISHAQAGIIHLLEGDKLRVAQVIGNFPDSMLGSVISLNQGIVGRVARNLTPELVLDVRRDPDYITNMIETRAQMTLPLVSQDRLIGVLNMQTTEPGQFTPEMFDFLKLLAARIASALENARLYQQTEQQLDELKKLYQQVSILEQTKTQMIRIAAHDLRNPLGIISGFLQVLGDELAPHMHTHNHEQMDAIRESVNRIDKITRDILTLERISAGQEMMAERIDIRQIVATTFEDARSQATLKQQEYLLELPPEPLFVRGDRFLLPETITNLIINAIKYTPEGGRVTVHLTSKNQQAVFTVIDNGYGIPADQQSGLFQPFFRVKLKETRSIKGTGLGLHLVKSVIERHNGQMRFESEYSKGSSFGFILPLIEEPVAPRKRKKAPK